MASTYIFFCVPVAPPDMGVRWAVMWWHLAACWCWYGSAQIGQIEWRMDQNCCQPTNVNYMKVFRHLKKVRHFDNLSGDLSLGTCMQCIDCIDSSAQRSPKIYNFFLGHFTEQTMSTNRAKTIKSLISLWWVFVMCQRQDMSKQIVITMQCDTNSVILWCYNIVETTWISLETS